jgi:orotidine-5'-phosphate decarboxylase
LTTFLEKLRTKWDQGKFVCIGLDQHSFSKNKKIVDQTFDLVLAYKPNAAFYEAEGSKGWKELEKIVSYIRRKDSSIPIILDAKRADIGSTNDGYAKAYFDTLGVDAITVHPYLGKEAIQPFLDHKDKGSIILVKTSNPGAGELQDLKVGGVPLYIYVAKQVADKWNANGNCAVVVGATYPKELSEVRKVIGDLPILVPGIGTQGGDLEATLKNGLDSKGQGVIISSSRAIINAKSPREATLNLHNQISQILGKEPLLKDSQMKLADLFLSTKTEAKVLRRKRVNGGFQFYQFIRKTSPIDFPANSEEFAIKVHEKEPDAPLSPIYVNLRNLPVNLLKEIAKVLAEVALNEKYDLCTGIPNTANVFAQYYSKASKIPYIDVFEKIGTSTDRKLVSAKGAKSGKGKKLLVIDDVISQGHSKFEAIKVAEDLGYKVGLLVLIDRSQGGSQVLKEKGYSLYSAFSIFPLIDYYLKNKKITQTQYKSIKSYFKR